MPLRQQSGFSPRTQSVCSVEAVMCCLTAESRLRPDRRRPTQYRGSLLRSNSLTSRAKARLCVRVCLCVFLTLNVCTFMSEMQARFCAGVFAKGKCECIHTNRDCRGIVVISAIKSKNSVYVWVQICGSVHACERDRACLPTALPCNLPLLHPG